MTTPTEDIEAREGHPQFDAAEDPALMAPAAPPTREDVDALARVIDPEAFEDHPIEQRYPFGAGSIQWAARRKIATDHAERVVAHLGAPEDDLPGGSWQNPAPAAGLHEAAAILRSGHQDIHLVQLTSDLADLLEASAAWAEAGGVLPASAALANLAQHILGEES